MDNSNTNTNPIQSADRIFSIVEYLAEHDAARISDLSEALGLHKSTVHRFLASLSSMGYVTRNEPNSTYSLTYKLVELSGKILKNSDIPRLVHPHLAHLSSICDETVHFVHRSGNNVIYLEKVESQSVKMRSVRLSSEIGLTRPMYCSAVGKAILAGLTQDEVREIWEASEIESKTIHTITSFDKLKTELTEISKLGYALDNEENELGIRCIAVPVFDYHDRPEYALSISTLSGRMPDTRLSELASLLLDTASTLSGILGSTGKSTLSQKP